MTKPGYDNIEETVAPSEPIRMLHKSHICFYLGLDSLSEKRHLLGCARFRISLTLLPDAHKFQPELCEIRFRCKASRFAFDAMSSCWT